MKLHNHIAIVTGGASGIGKSCAELFAANGATVVIADINESEGHEVANHLKGLFIKTDVTKPAEVEALIQATVNKYGKLDILMNNAGMDGEQKPIADCTLENWRAVVDLNLNAVFYGMKYGLAVMAAQKSGVILNTASIAGLVAFPNIAAYGAAKAGIIHLTKTAAIEYAKSNIRVNALCPSVVKTPLVEHFIASTPDPAATKTWFENFNPLPGMVTTHSVADAALFLVSDDSKFITGTALTIDGGFTAQ
ncbi:MAG: glucose 1-dehydrogenase [Chloroherpetonaceae bacterium]|nr:glucose 1-dehydrogenase [Chloroherpetonaceae bacterium]